MKRYALQAQLLLKFVDQEPVEICRVKMKAGVSVCHQGYRGYRWHACWNLPCWDTAVCTQSCVHDPACPAPVKGVHMNKHLLKAGWNQGTGHQGAPHLGGVPPANGDA